MAYLPGLLDPLELGILDEIVGPEGAVQRDVDVAVYRGGDHQPAVPLVVPGKVGAAAADRDAQRGLGDDHAGSCEPSPLTCRQKTGGGRGGEEGGKTVS